MVLALPGGGPVLGPGIPGIRPVKFYTCLLQQPPSVRHISTDNWVRDFRLARVTLTVTVTFDIQQLQLGPSEIASTSDISN